MIRSPSINDNSQIYSCWLAARRGQARIHLLKFANNCAATTPINLLRTRSDPPHYPINGGKISAQPSRAPIISTAAVPKSP
jgi:hypothetical protein